MNLITIDFESYYSGELGFKKQTTEEYVRDNRFEVIGVAVKVNEEPARWFSGNYEETRGWLGQFDWVNSLVLAHNTKFDGAILNWLFKIKPKGWLDTLCMARAIHGVEAGGSLAKLTEQYKIGAKGTEVLDALNKRRVDFSVEQLTKYGGYCVNDAELTYKLFTIFMADGFPKSELKVIDITLNMFIDPILMLDLPLLEQHLEEVKAKKERLLDACLADKDTLMSNDKFAELLRKLGVEPPTKISARTGKEAWAFAKTDEEFKELASNPDVRVQTLIAARLGNKTTLEETRTQRFIDIAKRGALPVPIKYYAAHTGRWGGCLVADTEVIVYNTQNGVEIKRIVDVLLDDLVWDGGAFVTHEGVVFSGFSEVIKWDGITGTEDHVVFTDAGEISLREAMQGDHKITTARSPNEDDVEATRRFIHNH